MNSLKLISPPSHHDYFGETNNMLTIYFSKKACPEYDTYLHLVVRFNCGALGNMEYPFIDINPSSISDT